MNRHATLEDLSCYLDSELEAERSRRVEEHLAACAACRQRLAGLGRVVDELDRLEMLAPPSQMGGWVEERLRPARGPSPLRRRMESRSRGLPPLPGLLPLFGVVVALAIIAYLFAFGSALLERRTAERPRAGAAAPTESGLSREGQSVRLEIVGRRLVWVGELWVEEGIDPTGLAEILDPANAAAADPELAEEIERLRTLEARVRLRYRDRVVELDLRP